MLRRWIPLLLGAGVVVALLFHRQEVGQTLAVLHSAAPWPLALALCLQLAYFVCYATLFRSAFAVVGEARTLGEVLPRWFATMALNLIAPTVSQGLMARGPRGAVGLLLVKVLDYGTFLLLLTVGMIYLALHHALHLWEVFGALALLALTLAWWLPLLLARLRPKLLTVLLARVSRWLRRPEGWASKIADEFLDASTQLFQQPSLLILPIVLALVAHLIDLLSLGAFFAAFHVSLSPGVLLAGFSIGVVFWLVSITPDGIGAVEGVMTLVFTTLGVPLAASAAAVLSFRAVTLYVPILLGLLFLNRLFPSARAEVKP